MARKQALVVDSFAGGGGASTGIHIAIGKSPDIAINHNAKALAMHCVNHPKTRHYTSDVWKVHPMVACRGRRPELAWFSPDCTYFSRARGAKPFRDRNQARRRRGLAGVVLWWAETTKPKVICLENVAEFRDWGPIDKVACSPKCKAGLPCKVRKGQSFRRWLARLENLGYVVEWRELRACDFGAPTTRKRLFLIARCDGKPIAWPEPTHCDAQFAAARGLLPYRSAAECIDWSLPTKSIFGRKKSLRDNTLRRIARGVFKFVIDSPNPFVIPVTHSGGEERSHGIDEPMRTITAAPRGEHAIITPVIARIGQTGGKGQYVNEMEDPLTTVTTKAEHLLVAPILARTAHGEMDKKGKKRGRGEQSTQEPLPTVTTSNDVAMVTAFLAKHYSERATGGWNGGADARRPTGAITTQDHHAIVTSHLMKLRGGVETHKNTAQSVEDPIPTITASGTHVAEVRAFLIKYYKTGTAKQIDLPLDTVTSKDRIGLVTIHGVDYEIVDIRMRMLSPRELFLAQGFPPDYVIDVGPDGERLTKTEQVQMVGNSAPPPVVAAIVAANCWYLRGANREKEKMAA